MRVQRPPTLLLLIALSLFANAFSRPTVAYIPEHCQSYTGKMLKACIAQTKFDTAGMYTNRVISVPVATGAFELTVDRDTQTGHGDFYDQSVATTLVNVDPDQD
ncbi:ORF3 [Merbecovirus sp.]|nr:ORF3 [Merbecovirus sp.]BDI08830.1 ORF3 [Merbecovirus sp.]